MHIAAGSHHPRPLRSARARRAARGLVALLAMLQAAAGLAGSVQLSPAFQINPPRSITGVCFYGGAMYAAAKTNVLIRYDPLTGAPLETVDPMIPVSSTHIHGITVGAAGTYWVGDVHSQRFFRMSFLDHSVVSTLTAPAPAVFGLTFEDPSLWLGYHSWGATTPVQRMDPETGQVLEALEFGAVDVHGLVWIGDYLWVLDDAFDTLCQVDRRGQIRECFPLPLDSWGALAYDGTRLWTCNLETFFHIGIPNSALCPPPGEVTNVRFTDDVTLAWDPPVSLGGSPLAYDVIRSADPADFVAGARCVEADDGSDRGATDGDDPPAGGAFFYLVRAENACLLGPGSLGTASNGEERQGRLCE